MKTMKWLLMSLVAGIATLTALPSYAQKEVTIAYQDMLDPYRVAQETKALEKATGYKINWKQFGGGGEVIKALASGSVQVGEVGSAGIAAAVSRGEPLQLFWILDNIGDAEALVAKNGSGINSVADLKGKKIATPFNSTSHFDTIVALEHAKVNPADVQILNMRPPEIRAAWQRGDIQATFIWDPVLSEVKKDGKVITSSGKIAAETGKATFDGYVVNSDWAKTNHDFVVKFVKILAESDDNYRKNKAKWTATSPEVKAVAKWSGAKAEDVPHAMALYEFPSMREQADKWLGGGKNGLAAKALTATAEFQKEQKQIEKTLPDYSVAVNASYVQDALK
ncbi:MAG: taurine ABC transporter substrate-binding protein [Casimicrobiaceae bacterium]